MLLGKDLGQRLIHCNCLSVFTQDAARVRDEGEQALELAERVRVNAEGQRAEAEGMFLVIQERERQLAQVACSRSWCCKRFMLPSENT